MAALKKIGILTLLIMLQFSSHVFSQDSHNCTLLGRWANGPSYAVAAKGDTAFLGIGAYMVIMDFSDTDHPIEIGKVLLPYLIYDIELDGNYAFVSNAVEGLRIIDISDAANPFEVGFLDTPGFANSVFIFY